MNGFSCQYPLMNYPDPRPSFYTFISSDFKADNDVRDQYVVDWHFIMNKHLIGKNFTLHVSNSFGSNNYTFNIGKMENGATSTDLNPVTVNTTIMPSEVGRASTQNLEKLYVLTLLLIVYEKDLSYTWQNINQ